MPDRILAVTDLSASGDVAITEAHRRATASGATLGVVHGVPTIDAIRPLFPQRLADDVLASAQIVVRAQTTIEHRLTALGVTGAADVFVQHGTTAEAALDVAARWQPTLLVVGAPDEAVDAERIVRYATVPVLVARTSPQSRRVIVGTDFSDPALPAIRAAAAAAEQMGGELVVVHAIEVNPMSIYGVDMPAVLSVTAPDQLYLAAQERLDAAIASLALTAQGKIYVASPGQALVQAAKELEAELVVVGTHGRTGVTRFLLGSVASTVIARAPCSVLVVRMAAA